MKTFLSLLIFLYLGSFIVDNSTTTKELNNNKSDTLNVNHAYWWPSGGPFIGLCGDKYSIVFTGTVTKIYSPLNSKTLSNDSNVSLYTPQIGIIKITEIKYKHAPFEGYKKTPGHNYDNETYFTSDCFYGLNLKEGDKVIVFIYSYEGEYCIPSNSILKIENYDDPIVLSIEKYIKNGQDPLSIRADTTVWNKYQLAYSLKKIIECKLNMK